MRPTGVLMVGSVPGASKEEVFLRLATALPGRLQAIPDGEVGERGNYVLWQMQCFPSIARRNALGGTPLSQAGSDLPIFTLADISPTGYDEAALSSYAEFRRLRQQNVISPNVRFQIGLPSPYNVLTVHVKPELIDAIEPLYEQRFIEMIGNIVAHIPHNDMVIQWDLALEMMTLEANRGRGIHDQYKPFFRVGADLQSLVDRVARLCERIPMDVPLAFHLCYGDLYHTHFVEPLDTSLLVELANSLLARPTLGPRTQWVHLPVPKNRTDSDYFAPLKNLNLDDSGSTPPYVYLGLVHADDEPGTKKRIETAQATVPFSFGVSTECGLGRTPPGEIDGILHLCRDMSARHLQENL
ncbi:hypothetical protein GGR57DRAFT_511174 [Xylariaceae sp. FL1272]|nr:hypothetical protein GGR57DRAFT_511174 [Xylariaceae sp. FL1272]